MPSAHKQACVIRPRRTILVFQGGGALGAYQAGVFEALTESGHTPDWVVGTSIGAINGALIAGNPPEKRLDAVRGFWQHISRNAVGACLPVTGELDAAGTNLLRSYFTLTFGLTGFFQPRAFSPFALNLPTTVKEAGFYEVSQLRASLEQFVDFDYLARSPVRLSVGAVDVETAQLVYFDSKRTRLGPEHIMASGALPPAFPAVEIEGRLYWDGGIYSNTPLEWILHEPREHSLCIFATLWQERDAAPQCLRDVLRRSKEIQYASRAEALLELEREVHRLRHSVSLLSGELARLDADNPLVALAELGCGSVFHLIHLQVPRLPGEDHTKDIEFDGLRVGERWAAGRGDLLRAMDEKPWERAVGPTEGIVVHDYASQAATPAIT